ncbi:hypothetical protein [Chitiniphilus shinanonensis]|uniref:hypothetical protein n=1 Tax=Chitiniphilus shinanonensis TaxID=553088 RepID=UPI00304E75F5
MVFLEDPIIIEQGATFSRQFGYRTQAGPAAPVLPVDLTGCILRLQVRERIDSPDILLELTSANGGIVLIDAVAGDYALRASASQTAAMSWRKGLGDLEVEFPGGEVRRLWRAAFALDPEVTRD